MILSDTTFPVPIAEPEDTTALAQIFSDIAARHAEAVRYHGKNEHPWSVWISLLSEEVGEAAREANWLTFGGENAKDKAFLRLLREELLDVAQIAVAAIKQIDKEMSACDD